MKILYLDHAPYEGGAEVSLKQLVTNLDHIRFQSVVIAPPQASYVKELLENGVTCIPFNYHWKGYSLALPALQDIIHLTQIIRYTQPDIIHTNTRVTNILGGILHYLLRLFDSVPKEVKLINHVRDKDPLPRWKFKLIQTCDQVIANSQIVKDFLEEGGILPKKIVVIYNGVDLTKFTPRKSKVQVSRPTITSIGQIYPRKGFRYLLQALKIIKSKYPQVTLQIAGADPTSNQKNLQELKTLAKKLHLEKNLTWLGYRTDIPDILAHTDVFVLPSLEEPFGRVLIEAMAMQVPVIASKVGGIPEIVEDGKTGYLTEPKNVPQLAERVVKLLDDQQLRLNLGLNGRKLIEEKFSLQKHVMNVERLYDKLANE